MKRRLFIAINFTEKIKKDMEDIANKSLHALGSAGNLRAVLPDDWHMTLLFLGDKSDDLIISIVNSLRNVLDRFPDSPLVEFDKVILSSSISTANPDMVWISGTKETSESLSMLRNKLKDQLIENGVRFKIDYKKFKSHITLAKFSSLTEQEAGIIRLPKMKRTNFYPKSIDLMESHLNHNKFTPKYETLKKIEFKNVSQ